MGDHDDTWSGLPILYTPTCPAGAPNCCGPLSPRRELISLPYHVTYTTSYEILCGLEGVDWVDDDADGRPDTCWDDRNANGRRDPGEGLTGVFDGSAAITVYYPDMFPELNGITSHTAAWTLGRLRFTGTPFSLLAGEAYMLMLSPAHTPSLWYPPVR